MIIPACTYSSLNEALRPSFSLTLSPFFSLFFLVFLLWTNSNGETSFAYEATRWPEAYNDPAIWKPRITRTYANELFFFCCFSLSHIHVVNRFSIIFRLALAFYCRYSARSCFIGISVLFLKISVCCFVFFFFFFNRASTEYSFWTGLEIPAAVRQQLETFDRSTAFVYFVPFYLHHFFYTYSAALCCFFLSFLGSMFNKQTSEKFASYRFAYFATNEFLMLWPSQQRFICD